MKNSHKHLTRIFIFSCIIVYIYENKTKHEWAFRDNYFYSPKIDLLLYGAVFFSIKSSIFISVAAGSLDCDSKERMSL